MNLNKFMLGCDLSHHNPLEMNPSDVPFVVLKVTEGATYVDDTWKKRLENITQQSVPTFILFYHYARPENNSPEIESEHFLKTIDGHIGKAGVALDWEGKSHGVKNAEQWAMRWLDIVSERCNTNPLIYMSASYTAQYAQIAKKYPLWVAHYGVSEPKIEKWDKWTMWQFADKPFDMNIFNGSAKDMISLIIKNV